MEVRMVIKMQVKFDYLEKDINLLLSKINIFYGYNGVGKTYLSRLFHDGFMQKNKKIFMINGKQVAKTDYEVFYLSGLDSIEDHMKLSSKSLINKIFMPDIVNLVNEDSEFEEFLFEKFSQMNQKISEILEIINQNHKNKLTLKIDFDTLEELITSIVKVSFENENLSESQSRMFLYDSIMEYLRKNINKKVVIIDNFDLFFDESNNYNFLKSLEKIENSIFILFTNKGTSLSYSLDRYGIFTMREKKIIDLSNIKSMLQYSIIGEETNRYSFEDYITSQGLILTDQEYEGIKKNIVRNININLSRMLINKEYSFDYRDEILVKILPNSTHENNYLKYIDTILKE